MKLRIHNSVVSKAISEYGNYTTLLFNDRMVNTNDNEDYYPLYLFKRKFDSTCFMRFHSDKTFEEEGHFGCENDLDDRKWLKRLSFEDMTCN